MSVFKSRSLPEGFKAFESLQISAGVTFAEKAFRRVLTLELGKDVTMLQREIILPKKKDRPKPLPHDPNGIIMRGELAAQIDEGQRLGKPTAIQRLAIEQAIYSGYRKLRDDDFEKRTVFFRATVRFGHQNGPVSKLVVARVQVFAISGWWHMADVKIWHRSRSKDVNLTPEKFQGAEYQVDGNVYNTVSTTDWQPPLFLKV